MTVYCRANSLQRLREIGLCLVNASSSPSELKQALNSFVELCLSQVDISPDVSFSAHCGDSELQHGIAINPAAAAQCVTDYNRTVQFIRAVHNAILAQRVDQTCGTIHLLYAGCGPYATLLLPILALVEYSNLSVHLLDIHEESLASVKTLITFFNLDDIKIRYHCENACEYQPDLTFDIIIAETMQKALEQEPQFMVTAQLSKLLKPKGIFIPEEIRVTLAVQNLSGFTIEPEPVSILTLNARSPFFKRLDNDTQLLNQRLNLKQVTIPSYYCADQHQLVLQTRIQVFQDTWLLEDECDLCLTVPAFALEQARALEQWQASYYFGSYPCLEFRLVSQLPNNER